MELEPRQAERLGMTVENPRRTILERLGFEPDRILFLRRASATPIRWEDGHVIPSTEPGLGVELNEDVVKAHPYSPGGLLHLEMCQTPLDSANARTIGEIPGPNTWR